MVSAASGVTESGKLIVGLQMIEVLNIFYSSHSDSTKSTNATQKTYTQWKKDNIWANFVCKKFAQYNIIVKSQYFTAPC